MVQEMLRSQRDRSRFRRRGIGGCLFCRGDSLVPIICSPGAPGTYLLFSACQIRPQLFWTPLLTACLLGIRVFRRRRCH